MRTWGWDDHDLRDALSEAHRVERRGRRKFEVWVRKSGSKKLVLAFDEPSGMVLIITGTEG